MEPSFCLSPRPHHLSPKSHSLLLTLYEKRKGNCGIPREEPGDVAHEFRARRWRACLQDRNSLPGGDRYTGQLRQWHIWIKPTSSQLSSSPKSHNWAHLARTVKCGNQFLIRVIITRGTISSELTIVLRAFCACPFWSWEFDCGLSRAVMMASGAQAQPTFSF